MNHAPFYCDYNAKKRYIQWKISEKRARYFWLFLIRFPPSGSPARQHQTIGLHRKTDFLGIYVTTVFLHFCCQHVSQHSRSQSGGVGVDQEKQRIITENLCTKLHKGIVLVTGETGSGKSTTLAALLNEINHTRKDHIVTLEDPIEYLHRHDKSIVSQREISIDTQSYVKALRASLRQSPDVILLGEMRDYETIDVAMTAAETGHLVFSTLHTIGAANTVDRIIDVFPANQQRQIAVQLSMVLQAVICQQLVPATDGTQIPVFEVMTVTPAIRNMIRDNKIPQIDGTVYSANKEEMHSTDYSLQMLVKEGKVAPEVALTYASNPEILKKKL